MHPILLVASLFAVAAASIPALAQTTATLTPISVPDLPLGEVTYPNGNSFKLNIGIGSAAYRDPSDREGIFYVLTDRGPNLDCAGIDEIVGVGIDKLCAGDDKAKNFPMPSFTPTIYELQLEPSNAVKIIRAIALSGKSGQPISGLPNPFVSIDTETAYDLNGKLLSSSPSGLDTEALVKLRDGTFWIGEEYASSIVNVDATGVVKRRLVPSGVEADLPNADYPIEGRLPSIIKKRALNRGIENLAMSGDGKSLYLLMQSPLANPDSKTYKSSANVRLWKIDLRSGAVLGEFLYQLDGPQTFRADNKKEARKQHDVRLSEMTWLAGDRLLVIERISKTTKFYVIDLANATPLPRSFDDLTTSPSLEQHSIEELAAKGIKPVAKALILDSDDVDGMPAKIEGVAVLSEREMLILNDSDFGIEGAANQTFKLTFGEPMLR